MANLIKLSSYIPALQDAQADILFGSGAPTGITAPQGSLYINITATTTTTRFYSNTDGGTTWAYYTASA